MAGNAPHVGESARGAIAPHLRTTSGTPPGHLRRTSGALGTEKASDGGWAGVYIHKEHGWGQDRTMCIKEMGTFPPSLPVHRNSVAMRVLSFSKVSNLGTARRRECKFENVAKKATPRRRERSRAQKRPHRAGESAQARAKLGQFWAPRAGESTFSKTVKKKGRHAQARATFGGGGAAARRRELHFGTF